MSGKALVEKRLVLGFDAGCMTCSDLAQRIEGQVGDKLEIRGLLEPQVEQWREEALGKDAPWTPTLIEVDKGEARAWTGMRMGVRLTRDLGPVTTWRILQELGELRVSTSERATNHTSNLPTRGQFIKGVAGGLVAFSVLPSTSVAASTTNSVAKETTPVPANSKTVSKLKKFESVQQANGTFGTPDWSSVFRVKSQQSQADTYLISYRDRQSEAVLATEDEERVTDAKSLVLRSEQDQGQAESITYYEPNGAYLATAKPENGQLRVETEPEKQTGTYQARDTRRQRALRCFRRCAGDVGTQCATGCILKCIPPSPGNIRCASCIACAGVTGLRCAADCA